ncbi:MAG: filamentous hemagglutinin N-terminal domain-containing protein, partial [Cyanobacteria bacterium P01_D01_bin.116]
LLTIGIISPVFSQITSDNTTNTTVNQSGNNFKILNGIQKGNNLFHSFKEFSIPTGGSATFQNSSAIKNIINRVTGGNISNIDGLIKANGNTNFFLINPNGIVFGENARLDIGGSFLGSTAESLLFEDGFNYSAIDSQATPLLTVSVPLGLQMGTNPGAIEVNGSGHNLISENTSFAPYVNPSSLIPLQLRLGLQVREGKNLVLVGGDINLNGGILNAETGRIDLASIKDGVVNLIETANGFVLNDAKISNLGNIQLLQQALIDVSGAGEVNLQSNQLDVKNGSVVMMQNRGIQPAGNINVRAKSVELSGAISATQIRSSLITETFAGDAGNINIKTEHLSIKDGAGVVSRTFGFGNSGVIDIKAFESIDVMGVTIDPRQFSTISSVTFGSGNSGNINLSTGNLSVLNSGIISTATFSSGSAGNVNINSENTSVAGLGEGVFQVTGITATTFGLGDAGNIDINTQTLLITDSANISTTSHNNGKAGNITVNASDFVEISNGEETRTSNLNSSVLSESEFVRQSLNLPEVPAGDGGNISIETPYLKVNDYGFIAVSNLGSGNAGRMKVNANLVQLKDKSTLNATNNSGEGGNILIEAGSLQMYESLIGTNSKGEGNGGNIDINTDTIVALENSDITANAENSFGGKVTINAEGIFGTQFRESLTPESDITATSELGVEFNGVVKLNTPGIDPSSGIVELPENLTDSSNQIAAGCNAQTGNSFVATGRGGIPENPNQYLYSNQTWSDIRDLYISPKKNNHTAENIQQPDKTTIIEATGFIRNKNGEIEFVASENRPVSINQTSECSGMNT